MVKGQKRVAIRNDLDPESGTQRGSEGGAGSGIIDSVVGRSGPRGGKRARYLRMELAGDKALTSEQWQSLLARHMHRCAYCGIELVKPTIDHVLPLSRGGLHTLDNVLPSCLRCNNEKDNMTPDEWGVQPRIWTGAGDD